eukprot:symbB.v1.2.002437.t2/scaffold126.1/size312799/1
MGRFDAAIEASAKGYTSEAKDAAFVVDNSQLRSEARGISYRRSMNFDDKDRKIAEFGSVVRGHLRSSQSGSTWLQVNDLYLPMQVADKTILRETWWMPETLEQPVERLVNQQSARRPELLEAAEVDASAFHNPPEVRPLIPGTGCLYEVVCERLILLSQSLSQSVNRRKGQVLELFDWDEQRQWRRIRTKLDNAWVALDFNQPLLRPQGVPFSLQPLDPLCQAAREGCAQDVRRFLADGLNVHVRDVDGSTPLMLAAQQDGWRGLVCSVLLLEANADPNVTAGETKDLSFEIMALEEEKRRAVEKEDYQRAQEVKEELAKLNQKKADVKTVAGQGNTAAQELLASLQQSSDDVSSAKLLAAFDEVAALPVTEEARNLPRRVQALQMRVPTPDGGSRSVPEAPKLPPKKEPHPQPGNQPNDDGDWLDSRPEGHGVLFRVLQTAPSDEDGT